VGVQRAAVVADEATVVQEMVAKRRLLPGYRSVLVGISGIDASGKGHVTARLVAALRAQGLHAVGINLDGWLNLPAKRFSRERPAEHFYENALRFEELFEQLILPLRQRRSLRLEAALVEETADDFHRHVYEFEDVDAILLEGIFLFKQAYRPLFDLAVWVDCSFETALERALARGQEGLPAEETVRAYETIYFPAQRLHFRVDSPRGSADHILPNDARL
jgi:uridine kinase